MTKIKRRYVLGIREVLRGLHCNKIKHVLVAPNLDQNETEEGLDSQLMTVFSKCKEMNIPVVFSLTRKQMGRVLGKNIRMNIVGIYNPDGVDVKGLESLALRNSLFWLLQKNVQRRQEADTDLSSLKTEYTKLCTKLHQLQLSLQPWKITHTGNSKFRNNNSEKWTIFVVSSETHRTTVLTEVDRTSTVLDKEKVFELNKLGTPVKCQKLMFINTEIFDNTIIGNIPQFMNYSTLTVLHHKGPPTVHPTSGDTEDTDEYIDGNGGSGDSADVDGGDVDSGDVDGGDSDCGHGDGGDSDCGHGDGGDGDSGDSDSGDGDGGDVDGGDVDCGHSDGGDGVYFTIVASPPPNGWRIDAAPFIPYSVWAPYHRYPPGF